MYGGCQDPSCVDMGRLQNKALEVLFESGYHLGGRKWAFPADPANYREGRRTRDDIDQIVIHTAEGYTGGLTTFQDPGRGASAHYAVEWDGTQVQMVADEDVAWHAGGSIGTNDRSIGIEHAGFAYAMQPNTETEWSRPMLRSSAKLVARIARKYGVPLNRQHIIAHAEVPDQSHTDPGPYWPWGWYMTQIRWYYYRPYILGALGVAGIGWYFLRQRRKRSV
jgi:N-acetyl-anhydromuramyl-L-alanine amidase AmpD